MLVNITPHELTVLNADRTVARSLPPSGRIARVSLTRVQCPPIDGVSISSAVFGALVGLPDPVEGTYYVCSLLAAQAAKALGRVDVLAPGELVRDDKGQPVGCLGLTLP